MFYRVRVFSQINKAMNAASRELGLPAPYVAAYVDFYKAFTQLSEPSEQERALISKCDASGVTIGGAAYRILALHRRVISIMQASPSTPSDRQLSMQLKMAAVASSLAGGILARGLRLESGVLESDFPEALDESWDFRRPP